MCERDLIPEIFAVVERRFGECWLWIARCVGMPEPKRRQLDLIELCKGAPTPAALRECALRCDVNKEHQWGRGHNYDWGTPLHVLCRNPRVTVKLLDTMAEACLDTFR